MRRAARILEVALDADGALAIAARSRGTPRVANRLLKRARDYAEVRGDGHRRPREAAAAGARAARGRRARPRPPRPRDPARDLRALRRRPRRALDARGRGRRGARHDRGRLRALPAAARADQAHAARPGGDRRTPTRTSDSQPPAAGAGAVLRRALAAGARGDLRRSGFRTLCCRWRTHSSAPTAAQRSRASTATRRSPRGSRAARTAASRSSSSCSTTTTRLRTRRSSSPTARVA